MPLNNEYEYNYQKHDDFYCYPDSDVLINKFDIKDKEALSTAERQITALKIAQLEATPSKGTFVLKHLKSIHKFIFGDIYGWAGNIRKGNFLIKGDSISQTAHRYAGHVGLMILTAQSLAPMCFITRKRQLRRGTGCSAM